MDNLIFEQDGEKYIQFSKYIEYLGYDKKAWNHQAYSSGLKNFGFVRLRHKGQRGGCKPARCFNIKDKQALDKLMLSLSSCSKNSRLFFEVEKEVRKCLHCCENFYVVSTKEYKDKFCSDSCRTEQAKAELETTCVVCGKKFHRKRSFLNRVQNTTCSRECRAEFIRTEYRGANNPNYKNKNVDSDGYQLVSTHNVSFCDGIKETKLHKALCCEVFGLKQIKGGRIFQIHHRDCDRMNNSTKNLVLLFNCDHRWLHKQFGNATLWAYMNGKVSLDDLVSWSDDPDRARMLLPISVLDQTAEDFGVIKDGVLYAKDES